MKFYSGVPEIEPDADLAQMRSQLDDSNNEVESLIEAINHEIIDSASLRNISEGDAWADYEQLEVS